VDGDVCEKEKEGDLASNSAYNIECLELDQFIAFEPEILF
jgi:hypothetical protein